MIDPDVVSVLKAILASAFVLRLGGLGPRWLPGADALALIVVALVAFGRIRRWRLAEVRSFVITHRFALSLAALAAFALAIRLAGLSADLGHTPIDIDEHRLAASVQHFFITGELTHETVEHYPGAVFWLFAAASLAGYVRALAGGLALTTAQMPVDVFVRSARLSNVLVGAVIVVLTGLIGRRLFDAPTGLLAALLVAVVPLSVETTTVVRNDPGMVLAVLAAVLLALVSLDDRRRGWVSGAGLTAGVAAGIKYSSLFALLPAIIAATAVAGAGALMSIAGFLQRLPAPARRGRAQLGRAVTAAVAALALWFPLSAGAIAISRRVTSPTHVVVERWLETDATRGSVVLLESQWLSLDGVPVTVRRVADLRTTLDGGVEQLAGAQWLVVPEPLFGHPTLQRLGLVQQIHAAQGFGGRVGYDYEVYAVPQMASPSAAR